MMDFSFNIFNQNILEEIRTKANKDKHKEVCGFIYIRNNKQYVYESVNISSDPKNFFAANIGDLELCSKMGQVIACFHSHVRNMTFTHEDIENSFSAKLNYLLYVIPENKFYYFDQDKHSYMKKYMNKKFDIGNFDCCDLLENFYKDELNIKFSLSKKEFIEKTQIIDSIENPYLLVPDDKNINWLNENNFYILTRDEMKKIRHYDVLILDGGDPSGGRRRYGKPTHFGIYLPNKMLLHHNYDHPKYGNRSIYECYRKAHQRYVLYIIRHKNFMS